MGRLISVAVVALAAALATGCAREQRMYVPKAVTLLERFDPAEMGALLGPGSHSIAGSAFMRQRGGGVVTCAGQEVALVPATRYASERMRATYGSTGPRAAVLPTYTISFTPDEPEFRVLARRTRCDAQGFFAFDHLRPGSYFVTTRVSWTVANRQQGQLLMVRVDVPDDQAGPARIVMTD